MEIKKMSETLEEGLIESKLNENDVLCKEVVEKGHPVFLSNLNKKCVGDVDKLESEINNVEVAASVEESVVFDCSFGNNQLDKKSLIGYPDDKLSVLMRGHDINNKDVVVMEGDLRFCVNDGVRIRNADEPVDKCGDTLHSHEPGSPTKIEVSGNSINLFVEVFGPLNGVSENGENGSIHHGVKDVSAKNEGEDIVGELDCTFNSGDLVWVKTQTQLWWPGMISGSPSAVDDTTKCGKGVRFLVKYFASPSFVWCDPLDLKPFVEYFAQLSGQNNKKNFICAVERAICEIGRRAKSVLTCPCFTKESRTLDMQLSSENNEENSVLLENASESDVPLLSQFEPATFCALIKQLACSVHVPGKIELMVMKNQLSSFYCSIGHHELPLQQLRSGNDAVQDGQNSVEVHDGSLTRARRKKRNHGGDESALSAKGVESRERKKSKYLSYPYVDVNQGIKAASTVGQEEEDPNPPASLNAKPTTPLSSGNGTKSRRNGAKKPLKGQHIASKADDINACSSDLLAELCSTARDCLYLEESKYSDSLKTFFCSFRACTFPDVDIEKHMENYGESVQKKRRYVAKKLPKEKVNLASGEESVENGVKRRYKKKKEQATDSQTQTEANHVSATESVGNAVGDVFSETVKENVVCSKAKKKEQVISAGLGSILNPFSSGSNVFASSSGMINFQQAHSNVLKSGTTSETSVETNSVAKLPDLNGNHPSGSVERIQEGLVSPNINVFDPLVFTSVPTPKAAPVILQSPPQSSNSVNGTNRYKESGSNVMNLGPSSFAQYTLQLGVSGSVPRKRKRKEKTCQPIPDLNGNVLDMSSAGSSVAEGEPQKKRAEVIGGTIILNFALGSTLPSQETLVATFSRYGILKKSELKELDDACIQIAYERISDARFAYRSLEKRHPFGESLINFTTDCMPPPLKLKKRNNPQLLRTFVPVETSKNQTKPSETHDVAVIKQKVEKMKLTLEEAGDRISAETRAKLENEIKKFLDKISNVPGSSSST